MPFWRGNLANCLRYFPTQALNFAFKDKIEENKLTDLSLSSNPWSSRLHILGSFLGSLLSLGILGAAFLAPEGFVDFLASLAALTACSLCAFLTSGFWFLLAMISWRVAPTTARWNLVVRLLRFLAVSSSSPFLCLRLYNTVHVTSLGFLLSMWALWVRLLRNL